MWEDIVLGTVPGTQVQVSFEMWLATVSIPLLVFFVYRVWRSENIRWLVVLLKIRNAMQTASYTNKLSARTYIQTT